MELAHQTEGYEARLADFVQMARDTIRRRWLTLCLVAGVIFALGTAAVLMLTPRYTAQTLVRIDPSRDPLSGQQRQNTQQELNPEALETEVSVLSSLDLAREVSRREKLVEDEEFQPRDDAFKNASPQEQLNMVAGQLQRKLDVGRDKLTYIIAIKFTSKDPIKAARIANAYAETYLTVRVDSKVGTAERQSQWFEQQLQQLGQDVRAADARVAEYRARSGLVPSSQQSGSVGTIADQQVAPLSSQLATADSDAAASRAALAAARSQIARGGLDSVAEVRSSPVINDLRRQRAEILRGMAEVSARYGARHPESIRAHEQLSDIDQQIKDEANRAIGSLEAAATAAEARSASLRGAMNRLESDRARNTQASVMADSLERDAAAKRAAFDRMSQMSLESTQAARNQISQAVVVESAIAPTTPSFPKTRLMIALSLIVGLAAGAATIIVQEMLVQGMRSVDEVESTLELPVLAAVPKLAKSSNPGNILLEKPTSLFAESMRIARAAIFGVKSGAAPRIIAFTSALPGEGKTTTSVAFARTLAMNGSRTIIVDCDVRRAQIRLVTNRPANGVGLVEVLKGESDLSAAITEGDVPNLDQLLVKAPYFSSEELFNADGFHRLMDALRERYEFVILDLPPLVGLADGRYIAAQADAAIMVLRWASTPSQAAETAVNAMRSDGTNPLGIVLTMVDSSSEAIGGLYYSKKYSGYYQEA